MRRRLVIVVLWSCKNEFRLQVQRWTAADGVREGWEVAAGPVLSTSHPPHHHEWLRTTLAEPGTRHNLKSGLLVRRRFLLLIRRVGLEWQRLEADVTTFNQREKSFENKFAHDADLKFKAEARRNKLLGTWAAAKLGHTGAAVDEYVKSVRKADLTEGGDDDVFRKIAADFKAHAVTVSDAELRAKMDQCLAEAVTSIESGS